MTTEVVDTPRPGEIEIDVLGTEPAKEPAAEPAAIVAEPAAEPAAEPEPEKKETLFSEMVEHRTVRKQLERERAELAPVLSRLTPELRQAIADGRVMVKPLASNSDERKQQLTQRAKRLRLYTTDAQGNQVPDLDAAQRVEAEIRSVAQEIVQPFKDMSLQQQAQHNVDVALSHAKQHGFDEEIVKEVFLSAPHAVLADPKLAETLWTQALGIMAQRGKLTTTGAAVKPEEKKPVAVISEPTGRRAPSNGIVLSPALAQVYKNNGVDPNKTFTATHKVDFSGAIELE